MLNLNSGFKGSDPHVPFTRTLRRGLASASAVEGDNVNEWVSFFRGLETFGCPDVGEGLKTLACSASSAMLK